MVTLTGVTNSATYAYNSVPTASCQTTDALSGVGTPASLSVTGDNGEGYGNLTATCSGAVDKAGNSAQPVSVSYAVQPPPNVTSSFRITSTGLIYNRVKHTGTITATIENISSQTLAGPLQLVFLHLSPDVTVTNATGTWGGNPYITIDNSSLAPKHSITLTITFSYMPGTIVTVIPEVYSGTLRN